MDQNEIAPNHDAHVRTWKLNRRVPVAVPVKWASCPWQDAMGVWHAHVYPTEFKVVY